MPFFMQRPTVISFLIRGDFCHSPGYPLLQSPEGQRKGSPESPVQKSTEKIKTNDLLKSYFFASLQAYNIYKSAMNNK